MKPTATGQVKQLCRQEDGDTMLLKCAYGPGVYVLLKLDSPVVPSLASRMVGIVTDAQPFLPREP